MKKLLLLLCICYSTVCVSQTLVADETWYAASGKNFKIICTNKMITDSLYKMSNKCYRITQTVKKDRKGYYWEHVFYFKAEYYNDVAKLLKTFNK